MAIADGVQFCVHAALGPANRASMPPLGRPCLSLFGGPSGRSPRSRRSVLGGLISRYLGKGCRVCRETAGRRDEDASSAHPSAKRGETCSPLILRNTHGAKRDPTGLHASQQPGAKLNVAKSRRISNRVLVWARPCCWADPSRRLSTDPFFGEIAFGGRSLLYIQVSGGTHHG